MQAENQAIDRVHRIGQEHEVTVHKLFMKGEFPLVPCAFLIQTGPPQPAAECPEALIARASCGQVQQHLCTTAACLFPLSLITWPPEL